MQSTEAEEYSQGIGPAAALRANKLWSWALSKVCFQVQHTLESFQGAVSGCHIAHAAHLVVRSMTCPAAEAGAAVLHRSKITLHIHIVKQARRPFVPGSDFSRDGDFVAAYYTEPRRHKLLEAGREWRKVSGIKTAVKAVTMP